jgi:hypothetical protein
MIVNREKAITVPVLISIWLSGFISDSAIQVVMVTITLVSIRMIVLYRNVQPVFIFYVFHLTYILMLIPYFMFGIPITPHSEFQIAKYMNSTLMVHGAFVFALYLFSDLKIPNRSIVFSENLPKRSDAAVYLLLTGIMMAIIVSMQVGTVNLYSIDADQGWAAYTENISGSGAPEYFLVFFLAAFIFRRKLCSKQILIGVFCTFSYLGFTRGMRVSLLMPILLIFALLFDGKFKTRHILLVAVVGMILLQAAGYARSGRRDVVELLSIYSAGQLLTNQGEVFYTSDVIVSSIIDGICGPKERIFSLIAASLQIILPPRIGLGNEGKPALYVYELTGRLAGGGGLISTFFYFWMGYLGVVLIAFFLAMVTNRAIKKPTSQLSIYIICVYSFYPRWLVYDPINFLFRLPLYAIGLYLLLMEFHRMMLKPKSTKDIAQECNTLPRPIP